MITFHEQGCHKMCQNTLGIAENPGAPGDYVPWTPMQPPQRLRVGQVTKLPAICSDLSNQNIKILSIEETEW